MPSLLIYEVESLFPRGPGEIDPGVKGPHAHGEPLLLPYPTSMAGILTTTLYNLNCLPMVSKASSIDEWFRDLEEIYELIKGPYIAVMFDDKTEVFVTTVNGWIKLTDLYYILPRLGKIWSNNEHYSEKYIDYKKKIAKRTITLADVIQERVSIALKHDVKTVEEHYLTTLRLLDYTKLVSRIDETLKYKAKVALGVDIYVRNKNIVSCIKNRVPARVLGRGRLGLLEIRSDNLLENTIGKLHSDWENPIGDGTLILYTISPMILSLSKSVEVSTIGTESHALTVYPSAKEIQELVKKELASLCGDKSNIVRLDIDGLVSTLGLGYSLKFNERKPLHNVLTPGSIIYVEVKNCTAKPKDIYMNGLGSLKHLGFGTMLPILARF